MSKKYCVEMPDGSIWAVPVEVIARSRAAYYAEEFGGDIERSLAEDTNPLFEEDSYEIEDWARGNMDWADVKDHAERVQEPSATDTDYQEGWVNGEVSYRE